MIVLSYFLNKVFKHKGRRDAELPRRTRLQRGRPLHGRLQCLEERTSDIQVKADHHDLQSSNSLGIRQIYGMTDDEKHITLDSVTYFSNLLYQPSKFRSTRLLNC